MIDDRILDNIIDYDSDKEFGQMAKRFNYGQKGGLGITEDQVPPSGYYREEVHVYETPPYPREQYLDYMPPAKIPTYTIPGGTILYHGSASMETFNPHNIQLGSDNLVAFFSANKRFAADSFGACSMYVRPEGYLHKFVVKKDKPIENILILSTYEIKKNWDLNYLENNYCSRKKNKYDTVFNGVGFFFPRPRSADEPVDRTYRSQDILFESEFAICNPAEFLEYWSTQRCISYRKLGDEYAFNL